MKKPEYLFLIVLSLILISCAPKISQENLERTRFEYNQAIVDSWNEQLLLNIVRLKYRDNPLFLELGTIVSSQSASVSGSLSGDLNLLPHNTGKVSSGVAGSMSVTPTMTFIPLQGKDFAERMLAPVSPATIFLLSQSGWSIERLFTLCVQRINGIPNAISASGPTPELAPEYEDFQKLSELLRIAQINNRIQFEMDKENKNLLFHILPSAIGKGDSAVSALCDMLKIDKNAGTFKISTAVNSTSSNEITVVSRSLLSVLFYVSQSVETPLLHKLQKLVTTTKYSDGKDFDWNNVTGKVMRIQYAQKEPSNASIKVKYKKWWFYIDETDLNSKTTFTLLTFLFNLQAAGKAGAEPILSYPVR